MVANFSQKVTLKEDVLIQQLGDESVLLHLDSEEYFGLDDVGTAMLDTLQEAASIQVAIDQLLERYDVAPEQLQQDLVELIEQLTQHGLVHLTEA